MYVRVCSYHSRVATIVFSELQMQLLYIRINVVYTTRLVSNTVIYVAWHWSDVVILCILPINLVPRPLPTRGLGTRLVPVPYLFIHTTFFFVLQ